jgi:hypothetical protein
MNEGAVNTKQNAAIITENNTHSGLSYTYFVLLSIFLSGLKSFNLTEAILHKFPSIHPPQYLRNIRRERIYLNSGFGFVNVYCTDLFVVYSKARHESYIVNCKGCGLLKDEGL